MKFVDKISVKNDTYEIHDTAARTLITETGNQVGELQGDVQLLDAQMDLAVSGINSLRDEVTTIENKQTVDEANIYQNTADITNLKPRVSAVEAVSSQNQADIVNLKSRMTTAENTLTTVNDSIDVINAINNQQTTQININKNDITNLKSRATAAEDDIADIRTEIDDLDERITASTYEAGIGIYFGQGDEHTNINIEDELIDKINAAGELGDRVTNLETNVNTINNNITTINNNITTINGEIDDIDDEIDDIWDAIHGGGGGGSGNTNLYANVERSNVNPENIGEAYVNPSVFRIEERQSIPTGPSTTTAGDYITLREFAIFADNESGNHWSEGGSLNDVQMGMNPADVLDAVFNTYIDNTPGLIVDETKNERIKKRDYDNNPGLIYLDLITNTREHRKIPMTTCNTVPIKIGFDDDIPSNEYYIDFFDAENKTIYRYKYKIDFDGPSVSGGYMMITQPIVQQISVGADASLSARVTACETNITNIQGDITTINGDISTINGEITSIQSDVGDLQTDMTTAQGDITTLQDKTNIRYVNFTSTSITPFVLTTSATPTQLTRLLADFKDGYQVRGIIDGPVSSNYNAPVMIMVAGDRGSANEGSMIFSCEEYASDDDNLQLTVVVTWSPSNGVQVDTKLIRPFHKSFEMISQNSNFEEITIRGAAQAEELYLAASTQNTHDRYFNVFTVLVIFGYNYQWATAQVTYNPHTKNVTAVIPVQFLSGTSKWGTVVMTIDQSYNVTYEYRREDRTYDNIHTSETSHVAISNQSPAITDLDNAPVGIYLILTNNNPAHMPSDITPSTNHYIYVETYAPKEYNKATVGTANLIQKCYDLNSANVGSFYQRMKVGTSAWSSWYKFTGTVVT